MPQIKVKFSTLLLLSLCSLLISIKSPFLDTKPNIAFAGDIGVVSPSTMLQNSESVLEELETQLLLCRHGNACENELEVLSEISDVYFKLGNYQQIIDLFTQAIYESQKPSSSVSEQSILELMRDKLENSWSFKAAYGLVENPTLRLRYSYGEMTWQEVIEISRLNLFVGQKINDSTVEIDSLHGLGWAYKNVAQYAKALEYYNDALLTAKSALSENIESQEIFPNPFLREYFLLTEVGIVYTEVGQYEEALIKLEQALELSDFAIEHDIADRNDIHARFQGFTLYNIGMVYLRQEQFSTALEYFFEAEARDSMDIGGVYRNIGVVYFEMGQYENAIEAFESADRVLIGDPGGFGLLLNRIGLTRVELNEHDLALDSYRQALERFREINDPAGESLTLSNIAALMERQGQNELAIIFYKQSVNLTESIRENLEVLPIEIQQSYAEAVSETYRRLADLLLQQDRIIEAQRVLDLLKVQELDDYLQEVQRNAQTESGVAYLRSEAAILTSYNTLQQSAIDVGQELATLKTTPQSDRSEAQNQRIAELTTLLDDINGDFRDFARSSEIRELIAQLSYEAQDASLRLNQLDGLRDELRQLNAAIFYPLVLEDRLELVITVPDSPPLRRTVAVGREDLNRAILNFREALTHPSANAEAPAQQLYRWLLEPLEADLADAGIDTIIYSPDGQLRYIPLAALYDGEQWLTQRYQINNITAESLTNLTDTDRSQPRILAAAYTDTTLVHTPEVNGTTYTFRGLPGAGDEVENLPTEQTFLDEAFSLDALRPIMDEYSVLHFATHAAFVPGVPEDSFILFGNGDTPTLRDIEDWTLNGVDLVVLSACETGVGGLGNGEEVLGLGYQFQVSGAKAVMASLWQVSDRGTQILMGAFYNALDQGMTKTEALQWAQTALINNNESIVSEQRTGIAVRYDPNSSAHPLSHPYYWAPFVIIGNGL